MAFTLTATKRELVTRGDLNKARAAALIPGVVYGHGKDSTMISVPYRDFEKLLQAAGTSSIIDLAVDGAKGPVPVLISEVQRDPLSGAIIHIDLHQIKMDEKLKTSIQLEFIGESPAVKSLGGNLIISVDSLNVECLPKDLVSSIQVDISVLENLDQSLHISDLKIPAGIAILDDPSGNVVSVLAPRAEEERPTPETAVVGAEATPTAEGAATAEAAPAEEKK